MRRLRMRDWCALEWVTLTERKRETESERASRVVYKLHVVIALHDMDLPPLTNFKFSFTGIQLIPVSFFGKRGRSKGAS